MARKPKKDTPLTPEEIEQFKLLLLEKRREILGNVVSMENDTLRKEKTDLSNMPLHMGDMGSDTFEVENSLNLVDSERRILAEIDQALGRIEEGTYGICLGNGKLIGRARMTAIPWAKYSIEFASQLERGLVEEPNGYQDEDQDQT
jgi:RNA polymerase-binding transcription factor DksA